MQKMLKITTIVKNDFNIVTFLHVFYLADFWRDTPMRDIKIIDRY